MALAKAAGVADAFSRFGVTRETAPHLLELLGLGALSVPVVHHLAKAETGTGTDRAMSGVELGGLATLAVPSITHLLRR
jgi:hypothetical protein